MSRWAWESTKIMKALLPQFFEALIPLSGTNDNENPSLNSGMKGRKVQG